MSVKHPRSVPKVYDDVRGSVSVARSIRQARRADYGEAITEVLDTLRYSSEDLDDVQDFVNSHRSCED